MRARFTAVVFSLELTHRWEAILPLLITATAAYLLHQPGPQALDPD